VNENGLTACRKNTGRPKGYIPNDRPHAETVALLNDVIGVLNAYRDHWPLTARQIYYRRIGAHDYPKTDAFYERLCNHLSNARRGRVIPFAASRDDGVAVMAPGHFDGEDGFYSSVRDLAANYERDKLARQSVYIEVWCEAAGMQPQLAEVAHRFSVHVYSCSGFDSTTAKYDINRRVCRKGKRAVILHLGDDDPSGAGIFDAVAEDVTRFVEEDRPHGLVSVEFRRVALTEEQVRLFDLPTAPPKVSDSRSKRWSGETCQLEARSPEQIAGLLDEAISEYFDFDRFSQDLEQEQVDRQRIVYALPAPAGEDHR